MTILLVNQTFYPDVVATAQHLTDVAIYLARDGHRVTVLTGARAYDAPHRRFAPRETWKGIQIIRVWVPRFNKSARWSRFLDVAGHIAVFAVRLAALSRFDVIVALTSPPLISVLATFASRVRKSRTVLWMMDLNPDEAVAAGWLDPESLVTRTLQQLLRYSLDRADAIVALDRFMKERLVAKGADRQKIVVHPLWAHDDVKFDVEARQAFRREHRLDDRFVVMYAGNHSPCHRLDTLLGAARALRDEPEIMFCFVGGGSLVGNVTDYAREHQLGNVVQLPYQPRARLGAVLSAADLHVVTMGDAFVGIVHPCKVYNVIQVGAPVLYIGPPHSHVTDLAAGLQAGQVRVAKHEDVSGVTDAILCVRRRWSSGLKQAKGRLPLGWSSTNCLPKIAATIESLPAQ